VIAYLEKVNEENEKSTSLNVLMVGQLVLEDKFGELIENDTSYAALSMMFVFVFFIFHLKSLFLAFTGIMLIIFSFPLTVMITEGILGCTFFSNLHSLAVFIVLGIAADDIFVFTDAWGQSKNISIFNGNKRKRMAYTFRRASRAMAVTSSTTAVAFFANMFSPIMPIKAFGLFAGVIVPANFFLVIMVFPSAVIFYEEHI